MASPRGAILLRSDVTLFPTMTSRGSDTAGHVALGLFQQPRSADY